MSNKLKFHINFGAVSFPVRIEAAARAESVSMNMIAPDGGGVSQQLVSKKTGEPVDRSSVRKGFELKDGRYAIFEESEIKALAPITEKVVKTETFVPLADIDPNYFESSFYVSPDEAAGGMKGYAVLYAALQSTGLAAVAKATMHQREHIVIMRAGKTGIILHKMFYQHEVKSLSEYRTDTSILNEKEREMGTMLISMMKGSFEPGVYTDCYANNFRRLIALKEHQMGAKEGLEIPPATNVPAAGDLMARMEASLAMLGAPSVPLPAPAVPLPVQTPEPPKVLMMPHPAPAPKPRTPRKAVQRVNLQAMFERVTGGA